jgi:hypothetical protein
MVPFGNIFHNFIDENWNWRSVLVDFVYFPGSHTGERIAQLIKVLFGLMSCVFFPVYAEFNTLLGAS